ncbi:hypothetical protein BDR26DRAFT_936181 [Obelidium mucronatum]|nr:hypothetical protein BDR26DRAFT_936181 [Obelidium mucronatum]
MTSKTIWTKTVTTTTSTKTTPFGDSAIVKTATRTEYKPSKPSSYDIVITMKKGATGLSPVAKQTGVSALAPKFPHTSAISIRVWSSEASKFQRILIGSGVFDDVSLIAVSHTWRVADGKPYYLWLDYLCTDQSSDFEVREATFKMAWVYSAAFATIVLLDESLSQDHRDFWGNRLWTMQEEALSQNLIFFDRRGVKIPCFVENVEVTDDPSADQIPVEHKKYILQSTNVVVAENQGPVAFREFWPRATHRSGGWDCDKVYATQYCSVIEPKLEIRYDLDYHLVLAAYIQKLIECNDSSCTGVSLNCPIPGWGCTWLFVDPSSPIKDWFVDGSIGFLGDSGLQGYKMKELTKSQEENTFLPKYPALGLVIDATVTLATVDVENEAAIHTCPLLTAIYNDTRSINGFSALSLYGVASDLMSLYWKLIQLQFESATNKGMQMAYDYEEGGYNTDSELVTSQGILKLLFANLFAVTCAQRLSTPLLDSLSNQIPGTIEYELYRALTFVVELDSTIEQVGATKMLETACEMLLKIIVRLAVATIWNNNNSGTKKDEASCFSLMINSQGVFISRSFGRSSSSESKKALEFQVAATQDIVSDLILYRYTGTSVEEASNAKYWPESCLHELEKTSIFQRTQVFAALNTVLTKRKGRQQVLWSGLRGLGRNIVFNDGKEEAGYHTARLNCVGEYQGLVTVDEYSWDSLACLDNVFQTDFESKLSPYDDIFGEIPSDFGWNIVRGAVTAEAAAREE